MRKFPLLVITLLFSLSACTPQKNNEAQPEGDFANEQRKPNIILVITDDQGYCDLGIHGNPIVQTPNIDQLARESISLRDYHVSPTCSPTRAALLTGHWSNRTGVWHTIMGRSMLRENELTIADLLKANGYHTAMFGKWHLGDNYPYRPMDRGFEEAYYHGGGGVGQTPDYWDNAYFDGSYFRNGVAEKATGFVTDVLFNQAINYIESVKSTDKPFFTYISTNAPHAPMHSPEKYSALYADKNLSTFEQHFFGMITNIDDNIAKLRRYLEQNQLVENTLFIFTTDNGTAAGEKVFNGNMRGKKGSPYDGGHRVPLFIHWPAGGLKQGRHIDTLTSQVDIVPTLLDYTGSDIPQSLSFDGVSLRPLIEKGSDDWPERILITDSQRVFMPQKWRQSAVMTDRWRLINGKELYDINKDPQQQQDIAHQHPQVVKRLRDFYHQWWTELEPSFGEPTAIYVGADQANPVELNAHDWLGESVKVPWHQRHVRSAFTEADGKHKGYWWLNIVEGGSYRIELRRWPATVGAAISDELPAGEDVPGEPAYRTQYGKGFSAKQAFIRMGEFKSQKPVNPSDQAVVFSTQLKPGTTKLSAGFINNEGSELGAYYVSIYKL